MGSKIQPKPRLVAIVLCVALLSSLAGYGSFVLLGDRVLDRWYPKEAGGPKAYSYSPVGDRRLVAHIEVTTIGESEDGTPTPATHHAYEGTVGTSFDIPNFEIEDIINDDEVRLRLGLRMLDLDSPIYKEVHSFSLRDEPRTFKDQLIDAAEVYRFRLVGISDHRWFED